MQFHSSAWGSDPSSDVIRVAKAIVTAQKCSALTLIPRHPVLNPELIRIIDHRNSEASSPTKEHTVYLTELVELLPKLISHLIDESQVKAHLKEDELVMQIDNLDMQIDSGKHAPPSLNYYRYVLETRYWRKVVILNWGSSDNPLVNHLRKHYPKIEFLNLTIMDAWATLRKSRNVVIGSSLMAQALLMDSKNIERLWIPRYAMEDDFTLTNSATIFPISISNYFQAYSWNSSRVQRKMQLEHPPSEIVDLARWVFTETERCRNFEFCKSCRDTGPTGKLWRKVIQDRFDVPKQDWDCPHGWKWGGKPGLILFLKQKLKLGSAIKKTTTALGVRPCIECEERGEKLDGRRA